MHPLLKYAQAVRLLHMLNQFRFVGKDSHATPALIFAFYRIFPHAGPQVMIQLIPSFKFLRTIGTIPNCVAHMEFDVMTMDMGSSIEGFVTYRTHVVCEINVSNKLACGLCH